VLSDLRTGEAHAWCGYEHWLQELLWCCDLQVDRHVEAINVACKGQEDVVSAGRVARKAVQPKQIVLVGSDTDSSSALLATEQQHPMFQRVQHLAIRGSLPKVLPRVSDEPPVKIKSVCRCEPAPPYCLFMPVWLAQSLLCFPTQMLPRMCSCPCPS
jgi:hypothetical protein